MEIKNAICSNCGKEFKPSHNIKKTAKSKNRFCSSSCAASFNNKNRYKSGTPDIIKSKTSRRLKARNYAIRKLLNLPSGKKMNKSLKNNEIDFKLVDEISKSITTNDLLKYSKTVYGLDRIVTLYDISKTCPICGKIFYAASSHQTTCSSKCGNQIISKKRIKKLIKEGISGNTNVGNYEYNGFKIKCDSKLEVAAFKMIVDDYKPLDIKRCDFYIPYIDEDGIKRNYFPDFIFENDKGKYIVEIKCVVKKKNTTFTKYTKSLEEKEKCLEKYANQNDMNALWVDFNTHPGLRKIYNQTLDEFKNKKEQQ